MKNVLKANAVQQKLKDIRLEQLELEHVSHLALSSFVRYARISIVSTQQEILAEKVARLELDLHNEREINSRLAKKIDNAIETKSAARSSIPRTCREARLADPSLTSGMHWIDPDGQGVGDDPIYVYCNTTTGKKGIV